MPCSALILCPRACYSFPSSAGGRAVLPAVSFVPQAGGIASPCRPQVDALCRPLSVVVDAMQLDTGLVIQNLKQVSCS